MKEITNITINTRYSKGKAVDILKKGGYKCLFMDFGRNQESFIREIAKGVDPRLVVEKMKDMGLVNEPEDTQDYKAAKPLFEYLPSLGVMGTNMYCYKEDASLILARDAAVRIVVNEKEVESLVMDHLRFVDMIIKMGYEEAYKTWSRIFFSFKGKRRGKRNA